MRLSKLSTSLAIFIIASAAFMRQVMEFIKSYTGEKGFVFLLLIIIFITGLTFFIFVIRKQRNLWKTVIFSIVLLIGLVLAWQKIKIPQERFHIFEYALLGWLSARDLSRSGKKITSTILACIFSISAGILDELFQKILPYRVFDARDIVFNSLGGIWGVILCWLR